MNKIKRGFVFLIALIGILVLLYFLGALDFLKVFFEKFSNNFGIGLEHMVYFKIFLGVLVFLIIFYVLKSASIPENKIIQFVLSLGIGLLAVFFISPEELYTIFQSYIVLIFAVPLVLVIWIIYMIVRKLFFPKKS